MSQNIRVLITDDHQIVRDGLRSLLALENGIEVVGEADNGKDALRCVATLRPDIVLIDLSMPHTNGTEAIKNIKSRFPQTKFLVLTVHKAEEFVHATLAAGANGYMLKDDNHADLVAGLRSVQKGKTYLSPGICETVVARYLEGSKQPKPSWEVLTHREREVVKLIAEGYRNKDIAAYLSLSPKTVEKHRSNSMRKLGLHSVSAITAYAIKNGLVVQ